MKTIIKYSLFLIAITIGLSSCKPKPLDIELEQAEVKLVISSQIIPNSVMLISVSKSFGALDYAEDYDTTDNSLSLIDKIMVKNAKVTVSYNGVVDELFPIPDIPGFYASVTTPQYINTEYTLNVYDPETGLSVSSKAKMLENVPFDNISAKRGTGSDSSNIHIKLSFTDNGSKANWYMLNFYTPSVDTINSGSLFQGTPENEATVLLSDIDFNGTQFTGEQTMFYWDSDTIVASISNISKEYYDYLDARRRGGKLFSTLFKEPINYPTNVKNGYGFFTTHYPDIQILEVQ
jgi:hypothetical protein